MKGVLGYTEDKVVATDFRGGPAPRCSTPKPASRWTRPGPGREVGVTDQEVVVAVAPFSGPASRQRQTPERGHQAYIQSVVNAQGIHGRRLRLVTGRWL